MELPGAPAPGYSGVGGRDQEDWGSKPAWETSSQDLSRKKVSKKKNHYKKRAGGVAQGTCPEFKPQYCKKKKRKTKKKKKTLLEWYIPVK
jgi:hypothetical protein